MAKRTPTPGEKIAQAIYETYKPTTVEEMNAALKNVFGPLFEAALKGELDNHLGYPKNGSTPEDSKNTRNGYSKKNLKTSMGTVPVRLVHPCTVSRQEESEDLYGNSTHPGSS